MESDSTSNDYAIETDQSQIQKIAYTSHCNMESSYMIYRLTQYEKNTKS